MSNQKPVFENLKNGKRRDVEPFFRTADYNKFKGGHHHFERASTAGVQKVLYLQKSRDQVDSETSDEFFRLDYIDRGFYPPLPKYIERDLETRQESRRLIRDEMVEFYLNSEPVRQALGIGMPKEMVKRAVKDRLERCGEEYMNPDCLIQAALSFHMKDIQATTATSESLEEKYRRFEQEKLCKICLDAEIGIVFLPCGHLASCIGCAEAITLCPVCRRELTG